ncbi:hypothetical protein [Pseudomonas phage PfAC02a]|nr:hypothetical protein [Pseudomonas phage PfAC02a]
MSLLRFLVGSFLVSLLVEEKLQLMALRVFWSLLLKSRSA